MTCQITGVWTVCFAVCSGVHQRKHQSFTSLVAVTVGFLSQRPGPVTRNIFPFDDVNMKWGRWKVCSASVRGSKLSTSKIAGRCKYLIKIELLVMFGEGTTYYSWMFACLFCSLVVQCTVLKIILFYRFHKSYAFVLIRLWSLSTHWPLEELNEMLDT